MTVVTPPTIVPRAGHPPEDDLDGLLHAYFKAEMPDPWPSFEAPAPRNGVLPFQRPKASRFAPWRSRFALAASVLLLIGSALAVLSGSWTSQEADKAKPPTTAAEKIVINPKEGEGASIQVDVDIPMR